MTSRPLLAIPLAFALWPAAGAEAQEGPSFDCGYASTRTEAAICGSLELAQLERRMVESYERLAAAIGRREARQIADELLARRQACEGDFGCIAERLLISMEVFEQRAAPRDRVAELVPSVPLPDRDGDVAALVPVVPAPEPEPEPEIAIAEPEPIVPEPELEVAVAEPEPVVPEPETEVAAAPAPAEPDIPLAAQAPWPPESAPLPPSRDEGIALASAEDLPMANLPSVEDVAADDALPASEDLGEAIDGAELASSDGAGEASFDTPLSWAFMDLEREQRAAIQERLAQAGFYEGEATGAWTIAAQASLERFAAEEGSESFNLATQSGAALLLDYIGSDAFATAFGIETAAAESTTEPDPLAGADW